MLDRIGAYLDQELGKPFSRIQVSAQVEQGHAVLVDISKEKIVLTVQSETLKQVFEMSVDSGLLLYDNHDADESMYREFARHIREVQRQITTGSATLVGQV
ncbi:MAG: hypothetical protein AB7F28_07550 [Candidatus Margulisiibacteriota bacterium]